MPALIKPDSVKIVTRDGELQVLITLELNINLNTDGVKVSAQAHAQPERSVSPVKESTEWAIPDFEAAPKLKFGKRE